MTHKTIEFNKWPQDRARRYRDKGYWLDRPLTRILIDQCESQPDAAAIICGERQFSYGDLDRLSSNLASQLTMRGLGKGDTALVQLPNIAEFYIVFFALLKAGITPLNALYSHRQHELGTFARQISPRLVIASREHQVFQDNRFIDLLSAIGQGPEVMESLNNPVFRWKCDDPDKKVHF